MAGYETRQSSYSDGDVIIAAHTNDEFDAIVAAMNAATGHAHDGTAGEGPVIALIGDAGSGSPLNRIQIDTANDQIGFFIDDAGTSVEQIRLTNGALLPVTDSDVDLGSNSARFKNSFTDTLTVTSNITVGGTVDGRDVASDGTKLDGIEANADVTDFANVQAAGALMDSELTSVSAVKAINQGLATTDAPSFTSLTLPNGNIFFNSTGTSGDYLSYATQDGLSYHENGGAPTWRLAGAESATFPSWIGSSPTSGGHLGIGTNSPVQRLDVRDHTANEVVRVVGNTAGRIIYGDQANTTLWSVGSSSANGFSFFDAVAGHSSVTFEAGAAVNTLYVDSASHVGFGTSSPALKLHVNEASAQSVARFVGSNAGYIQIGDQAEPNLWEFGVNTSGTFTVKDSNAGVQVLNIQQGAGSGLLHLDSAQRVGVKTTSPAYDLDVNGIVGSGGYVINSTFPRLDLFETDTTDVNTRIVNNGGKLFFQRISDNQSTTNSTLVINHSNDRVGVQTNDPFDTLHVNGSFRSTRTNVPQQGIRMEHTSGANTIIGTSAAGNSKSLTLTTDSNSFDIYLTPNSGKVGINTTSLGAHALTVAGHQLVNAPGESVPLQILGGSASYLRFGDQGNTGVWDFGMNSSDDLLAIDRKNGSQVPFRIKSGAGNNKVYINSNGRVGINETAPQAELHVNGDLVVQGRDIFFDTNTTSGDFLRHVTTEGLYWFENGTEQGRLGTGSNQSRFFSNVQIGNLSTGNLGAGTEDGIFLDSVGQVNVSRNNANALALRRRTGIGTLALFRYNTNTVGSIEIDSTTTVAFNTSSDERLKENIVDAKPSGDVIDAIKVREFNWKDNGVKWDYGFVAQELNEVYPLAVSPAEDEDADPLQDPWQVDMLRLIPVMMKELQELRKRVAELESSK